MKHSGGTNPNLPPLDPELWQRNRLLNYQAKAKQAAELPFIPLEVMPEQLEDFNAFNTFAQDFQRQLGLEPTPLSPSMVHTVSPETMANVLAVTQAGEAAGFWEWFINIAYVPQIEPGDRFGRGHYASVLAHELTHSITPGNA